MHMAVLLVFLGHVLVAGGEGADLKGTGCFFAVYSSELAINV